MLSNIKIEHSQDRTTYQILDPENGSIIAVGSIPFNEWSKIHNQLMDEIDDTPGLEYAPTMMEYLIVLLVHSGLERVEDGS